MPDSTHTPATHTPATRTATLADARSHARSLAGAEAATGPTVPATSAVVALLVYRTASPNERLNVADTVKVQWQAYLGPGALLLSDMGRVLMTIVDDTSSRHDCLCGTTTRRSNDERFGSGDVSGPTPNGRDLLALGAAKLGLGRPDVAPNINLFKSVRVSDDGGLTFDGAARPGCHIDLRAEMDVSIVVANAAHPLDDRDDHSPSIVRCTAWLPDDPPTTTDPRRTSSPERQRAFENTDALLAGGVR